MISLKSSHELKAMQRAGRLSAQALRLGGSMVEPGVSTWEIDKAVHDFIVKNGAKPSFLNYGGFPASVCISINNEVIHGIPSRDRIIHEGDIVSLDVGACLDGYNGDNAATFPAGKVSEEAVRLMDVTRESLMRAIAVAKAGMRIGDIGYAVQSYVEAAGFAVVRKYIGHGVGLDLHEEPDVPNYGKPGRGVRLVPGMTIAIEPMVNAKGEDVRTRRDGSVVTTSGSLSAHFEHTVAITTSGCEILTLAEA